MEATVEAVDGSGGGGSTVGGRHGEVDRSRKRMGSGFFSFGFLLFFLASVTKGTSECLPQGQNRSRWEPNTGVGSSQGSSPKGDQIIMPNATADRHQHVPSHRPHNYPVGEGYFYLPLTGRTGSSNCTRHRQDPDPKCQTPRPEFQGK